MVNTYNKQLITKKLLTFHPKFSKNVHSLDCPVVLPPQGPEKKYNNMC